MKRIQRAPIGRGRGAGGGDVTVKSFTLSDFDRSSTKPSPPWMTEPAVYCQRIAELEAKNAELETETAELRRRLAQPRTPNSNRSTSAASAAPAKRPPKAGYLR